MFEWDDRARIENLARHGVDFVRAARMFDNPVMEREDTRQFAGEMRHIAIGHHGGFYMVVVTTPRNGRRRIVQAWRADRADEELYRAGVPQAARAAAGSYGRKLGAPSKHGGGILGQGGARLSIAKSEDGPPSA
ncbi:MAG: BrnT family toxin [Hyphomonadaceae bacterium]